MTGTFAQVKHLGLKLQYQQMLQKYRESAAVLQITFHFSHYVSTAIFFFYKQAAFMTFRMTALGPTIDSSPWC